MSEKECAWCGATCDDRLVGIRTFKLAFITNGVVAAAGEVPQETLYFCSGGHRIEYYFGL